MKVLKNIDKRVIHCKYCGVDFLPNTRPQLYCSNKCRDSFFNGLKSIAKQGNQKIRHCKRCGSQFEYGKEQKNKQHCGIECSLKSARLSRTKYQKIPINITKKRDSERKRQIGNKERVFNRYPDLPRACQSCGEDRVIDIAHRPEFKRNGAWRSVANCSPEKIWILCPTCHALIDRMHYDPKTLGL